MKNLSNERGVALVTSLLLTMLALAIIMALLYMVSWQTRLSAAHKRYRTSIEASQGGVELVTKQFMPFIFTNNTTGGLPGQFPGINLSPGSSQCLVAKMTKPTNQWGVATALHPQICASAVPGGDNYASSANLYDPTRTPDFKFTLQGTDAQSAYSVYAKIVDTIAGNSDLSGFDLLDSGAGVAGTGSGVSPKHMPAIYRIEVQGQKTNAQEKAQLSVLYAY